MPLTIESHNFVHPPQVYFPNALPNANLASSVDIKLKSYWIKEAARRVCIQFVEVNTFKRTHFSASIKSQGPTAEVIASAAQNAKVKEAAARAALSARIRSYANLQEGWDGYNANAVHESAIINCEALVNNLPFDIIDKFSINDIYPTPNGTITIEIGDSENYFVIDTGKAQVLYYFRFEDNLKGLDEAVDFTADVVEKISELFTEFQSCFTPA
ncbi:hypothetical protein [Hymenobacter guriensis]|uniref:Uncharacterized protein n=1 Tax=Hymenobacter guriensis TaxID=2793065 RepID=A0ABS0L4H3_9BACT|nr:hypothetical protein [Hymenobacter guriensis]MBG8555041.1 hypothetical protein [Hymenobacter guriensis]